MKITKKVAAVILSLLFVFPALCGANQSAGVQTKRRRRDRQCGNSKRIFVAALDGGKKAV